MSPEQSHGLGAIRVEQEDPRDYVVAALYAIEDIEPTPPAALPASYSVPNMPPVIDQNGTPQCVAYSTSAWKSWADRKDQSAWFNFNEGLFFKQIGGTENGAVVEVAMERLRTDGYPVVTTGAPQLHKIQAYYVVPTTYDAIRAAILDLGPVIISTDWFDNWFSVRTDGTLRAPGRQIGGHAIIAYGWDSRGLRLRNSWGADWGKGGDCWLPAAYFNALWRAWKAVDQIVHPIPWKRTVVTTTELRMRKSPTTTAPILATLAKGHRQSTRLLEKYGGVYPAGGIRRTDWYQIDHNNKRGWIARGYTKPV